MRSKRRPTDVTCVKGCWQDDNEEVQINVYIYIYSVLCVRTTQRVVVVDENLLLLSETQRGVRNRREKRKLRASYMYVYMYIVIYTRIYIQCHVRPEFSPEKPEAFQPLSHCKTRREDIILVKGFGPCSVPFRL